LPLGLRVQDKLEKLIDKHMRILGASKVLLSSLSSEDLWRRSGRLEGKDSEFLRLQDRKGAKYLLSPTHEEEITSLVANAVSSYKDLPLRLYQVSRKYRDEARPRQGLLRGREFLMKDLYTFDVTDLDARLTYEEVRKAYSAFLDELHLPYLVANADSGSMGGTLSHEYHFVSHQGEDNIINCSQCRYSINEELYIGRFDKSMVEPIWKQISESFEEGPAVKGINISHGNVTGPCNVTAFITKDRKQLLKVVTPENSGSVNIYAVKKFFPDVDTAIADPSALWSKLSTSQDGIGITVLVDQRLGVQVGAARLAALASNAQPTVPDKSKLLYSALSKQEQYILTSPLFNDTCPSCQRSSLQISKAIEIGHTFHLGTRYSTPLGAKVQDSQNKWLAISMGCHGIGVSRLIGAVAGLMADGRGLNWPEKIAPFQIVVVPGQQASVEDSALIYDNLVKGTRGSPHEGELDVVIDDRARPLGWKLKDADLVGYPFIIVLGRSWPEKVEVQCRRLGIKEEVAVEDVVGRVLELGMKI
jgi:prolyl-tRNA synthetase